MKKCSRDVTMNMKKDRRDITTTDNGSTNVWIDMINPSDVHFFKPLISDLFEYNIFSTTRDRAETVELANRYNINNRVIGTDYNDSFKKVANMIYRTMDLTMKVSAFDVSLSFENGMCVLASKLHMKTSILYCDNDLKFVQKKSSVQDIETKIKSMASCTIVPSVCYDNFKNSYSEDRLMSFDGYKEDVYIADYKPDQNFLNELPFDRFMVVRPEALSSVYVRDTKSIVPELITSLVDNGINVIYLPRDKGDKKYADGKNVFIPKNTPNGLDLCYYADAILTGSGTLAREASCMGTPSVSFFPSEILLSVDQQLADEGKMLHSRDIEEIVDYIKSHHKRKESELHRCNTVKKEVVTITRDILNDELKVE
jgi:predicted glycosyltransferase